MVEGYKKVLVVMNDYSLDWFLIAAFTLLLFGGVPFFMGVAITIVLCFLWTYGMYDHLRQWKAEMLLAKVERDEEKRNRAV